MGPDMNYTGERAADPLTFRIHPAEGAGESTLYEDAGDGFGYENGEYARRDLSCDTSHDRVTVRLGEREGSFVPERREVILELRGIESAQSVLVDGEEHDPVYQEGALTVSLGEEAGAVTVEVIL